MEPTLVKEWETAYSSVTTLTVFNEHLYSGGGGWGVRNSKIQKWNENGQLVREWETAHTSVNT